MATNTRVARKAFDQETEWLENELIAVSRNLLQRPLNRRGPFVIEDCELDESIRATKSKVAG